MKTSLDEFFEQGSVYMLATDAFAGLTCSSPSWIFLDWPISHLNLESIEALEDELCPDGFFTLCYSRFIFAVETANKVYCISHDQLELAPMDELVEYAEKR